eukprot:755738-Hanusia_phi.AAC.3
MSEDEKATLGKHQEAMYFCMHEDESKVGVKSLQGRSFFQLPLARQNGGSIARQGPLPSRRVGTCEHGLLVPGSRRLDDFRGWGWVGVTTSPRGPVAAVCHFIAVEYSVQGGGSSFPVDGCWRGGVELGVRFEGYCGGVG